MVQMVPGINSVWYEWSTYGMNSRWYKWKLQTGPSTTSGNCRFSVAHHHWLSPIQCTVEHST